MNNQEKLMTFIECIEEMKKYFEGQSLYVEQKTDTHFKEEDLIKLLNSKDYSHLNMEIWDWSDHDILMNLDGKLSCKFKLVTSYENREKKRQEEVENVILNLDCHWDE